MAMTGLLETIAKSIWGYLMPWLEAKWQEVKPKLFEMVKKELQDWLPQILKTITVGLASAAGQLVVKEADRITDVIPGPVDDFVVDKVIDQSRAMLRQFGIEF